MFIKLKADGTLLDEINISPKSTFDMLDQKIVRCGRWGEGTYAFGSTFRVLPSAKDIGKHELEHFLWIIKTDSQGKMVWEKLIPTDVYIADFSAPQLLPNGNLVFAAIGNGQHFENGDNRATELVVMSPDGTVKARRQLFRASPLVKRSTPDQPLIVAQLPTWPITSGTDGSRLLYLDESLATIKQHEIDRSVNVGFVNYFNGINELVSFSWAGGGSHRIRSISRIDLANDKVELIEPGRDKDQGYYEIKDAAALDAHGAFAFVNQRVIPSIPGNHFAVGITLINLNK